MNDRFNLKLQFHKVPTEKHLQETRKITDDFFKQRKKSKQEKLKIVNTPVYSLRIELLQEANQ